MALRRPADDGGLFQDLGRRCEWPNRLFTDLGLSEADRLVTVLTSLTSFETFDALARSPETVATATAEIIELAEAAVQRRTDT